MVREVKNQESYVSITDLFFSQSAMFHPCIRYTNMCKFSISYANVGEFYSIFTFKFSFWALFDTQLR